MRKGDGQPDGQAISSPESVDSSFNDRQEVDPLVGRLFAGKYTILSVLGSGGMSMVYLARHESLNKLVAVKVLHTHLTGRSLNLQRFEQEAQTAANLSHSGIVAIHDYGVTAENVPYLIMDYIEGESLAHLLERKRSLDCAECLPIFIQICNAMAYAHEQGLVHRDLKPSNIMLQPQGTDQFSVKLVDFGVAKVLGEQTQASGKLTQTGDFIGSPLYMSPEQCQGKAIDPRSDIYSFGCVMYETLTGVQPFAAESIYATLFKHADLMPPPISSVRKELAQHRSLEKTVLKALAKEPSHRYDSMAQLEQELKRIKLGTKQGPIDSFREFIELVQLKGHATRIILTGIFASATLCLVLSALLFPRLLLQPLNACPPSTVKRLDILWPKYPRHREATTSDVMSWTVLESEAKGALGLATKGYENKIVNEEHVAKAYQVLAKLYFLHDHIDEAMQNLVNAVEWLEKCKTAECIHEASRLTGLRDCVSNLAECQYLLDEFQEAAKNYAKRVTLDLQFKQERRWLFREEPYLRASLRLADCYYRLRKLQAAANVLSTTDLNYWLMENTGNNIISGSKYILRTENSLGLSIAEQHLLEVGLCCSERADIERQLNHLPEAISWYKRAIKIWEVVPESTDKIILARAGLADCFMSRNEQNGVTRQYEVIWKLAKRLERSNSSDSRTNQNIYTILALYSNFLLDHSSLLHDQAQFFKGLEVFQEAKKFLPKHLQDG